MGFLRPLYGKVTQKPLWGFDIETAGKNNDFVMGSIIGDYDVKKVFWNKKEFIEYLFSKSRKINKFEDKGFCDGYITATNLTFDILGLLEKTKHMEDIQPIIRSSHMVLLKLPIDDKRSLNFIDTFSFCKFSVKVWGDILQHKKLSHPDFLGQVPKNQKQRDILEKYNIRDSEITYKAIKMLQDGFNSLGAKLKITVASTSMDLFRRRFMNKTFFQPDRTILDYLYRGYYGGRTEIIKRGYVKNLKYYDFNSLYPDVMRRRYPSPENFKYSRNIKLSTIKDYEGVCKVTVNSPDLYIPYLPFRIEKPEQKLIFPTGEFTGYYTFFELRKALKLGYVIKKFYDGVIYFKYCYPFKNYVDKLYALRKEQKINKDPREIITKLNMNTLYGKFAQKIESKETIMHESKVTMEMLDRETNVTSSGDFFIFNRPYNHIPAFVNPIFSIYTTAYARDKLYNAIEKTHKKIYYYDTDSLMTTKSFEDSIELGRLKQEFTIKEAILVKPKMYFFNAGDKDFIKCKGLGRMNSRKEFNELLYSKKKTLRKYLKFKEANRRHLEYNQVIDMVKTINLEDNKRIWSHRFNPEELEDSRPITI